MQKSKVEIIYCNDDIVVINKPAGVSVTKDRSGEPQLVDIFACQLGIESTGQLRLVHRLDKDTSGVMILAKNIDAQTRFCGYFENRLVEKTYLALVNGIVPSEQGTITSNLTSITKKPGLMCVTSGQGKESITQWRLLADFGAISLLAVSPLTGRTHQIRVHLPSIGLPLVIDPLYGSGQALFLSNFKAGYKLGKGEAERPLIERLTLHAYQIKLAEPPEGCPDCFVAGLDKKFAATIKMLAKYNSKGPAAFLEQEDLLKITKGQAL